VLVKNGGALLVQSSIEDEDNSLLNESHVAAGQEAHPILVEYLSKESISERIVNPNTRKFVQKLNGKPDDSINPEENSLTKKKSKENSAKFSNHPEADSHADLKRGEQFDQPSPRNPISAENETKPLHQRSKMRKNSSMKVGSTIILPDKNSEGKGASLEKINTIINDYLPIAIFLAHKFQHEREKYILAVFLKKHVKDMDKFEPETMMEDQGFLHLLLKTILVYEEGKIFTDLLKAVPSMNIFMKESIMNLFVSEFRFEYLQELFIEFKDALLKNGGGWGKGLTIRAKSDTPSAPDSPTKIQGDDLTRDQIQLIIKNYALCDPSSDTLMMILKSVTTGPEEIVKHFLESGESDRLILIAKSNDAIAAKIKEDDLIAHRCFKVMIVFDRGDLIKIFNKPINNTSRTVYDEICRLIGEGTDVEDLCNVVIHVHNTFWDMEKLPKFHKALEAVLSDNDLNQEAKDAQNDKDAKDSWLLHIQNPLLFCIKLVYFFQKMKNQLDFKNKEMNDLKRNLLNFTISFCQNADEDVLMINLFDKDTKERGFLDYAFMVQEMSILDIEFIEGLIYKIWDLGRHTMQTITQFMRVNFMKDEIKKFTMGVFTRKYEMPIEEGDAFQMEFRFTSNSVKLRVVSDIIWPMTLILMEFIFSMRLISMYKNFQFDGRWMSTYFWSNPVFSVIHLYMRGNFIVSNILKSMLMKMFKGEGFYHKHFFNILNVLYILQMFVYTVFFWHEFWLLSNLQMLIVLTMVGYVFYNSLALNDIGIVLRIFMRMVFVVLLFGIVSCFIILMIAYPLHTIYIDFSQVAPNQMFPQLNMFRSLYNGVLTLFEFVFGAVVFVRPYLQNDMYTYSMSFIMVIFSFFGNIMMANMLVAFLSRQFETITRKAKYYTQRMQFGLVKIFNMQDLDSIFTMPYPLTAFCLPFYMFMIKRGNTRKKVNLFLRKVIHTVNIFIPTFLFMNIFLLILMCIRYVEILLFVLVRAPVKPMYILYFFAWMLGGPFLLLKLYCLDVKTMLTIMLDFSAEGEDLLSTSLNDDALKNVIHLLKKISREASHYMTKKHHKESSLKISIQKILEYMGLSKSIKKVVKKRFSVANDSLKKLQEAGNNQEDGEEEEEDEEENAQSFAAKYSAYYSQNETKLIPVLLKKFAIQEGKSESTDKQVVDIGFMLKKLKNNVNLENVHKLIGFDKTTLDKANRFISDSSSQNDVMTELVNVKEKMSEMDKQIDQIINIINDLKAK
jgi:hypothetical protein